MARGELSDRRLAERPPLPERAVCSGHDASSRLEAAQVRPLQAGVQTDLVDRGHHAAGVDDAFQLADPEVRDPD